MFFMHSSHPPNLVAPVVKIFKKMVVVMCPLHVFKWTIVRHNIKSRENHIRYGSDEGP